MSSARPPGIDGVMDVAIAGGKIAAVGKDILPSTARQVTDVRGKLVLPGMIDTHAHVYRYVTGRFGLDADMVGVESGVTTLIDQGGASCMTFPGFRHFVAEKAASRCYAFISAYLVGGLEGHYYPSLYSPDRHRRRRRPSLPPRPTATSSTASRPMPRSAASRAGAPR